mmetsp:Transcript_23598/g.47749  ORF Transcript_23598/g.47749 Transcript_23598/m.47749 type:complete len:308 (-) Transcript_23598:190-1113(-)
MVEISEVSMEETSPTETPKEEPKSADSSADAADSRSQERLSDADEIEAALAHIARPSARLHVQNLVTKLRKEGAALQRVSAMMSSSSLSTSSNDAPPESRDNVNDTPMEDASATAAASSPPKPTPPPKQPPTSKYQAFPTYYFDPGQYNSPTVSIYVPLEGIGQHDKSKITCQFTPSSFDLVVSDFEGKSYRLVNDNLEKDIEPSKSKYVVKPNKIIIKLGKVKGEYSYDHWTQLTAKKAKRKDAVGKREKDDPAAGIMDLMRDMYEEGDDNMKKMIGETMYKQRTGQLDKMDPMAGMGGMGDFGGI